METTVYIKYEAVQKLDVWIAKTTRVVSHFHVYWTMQLGWRYKYILFQEYLETGNIKTNFPLHRSQETLQQACHALCLSVPHLYKLQLDVHPSTTSSLCTCIMDLKNFRTKISTVRNHFVKFDFIVDMFSDSFNHSISGSLCFILWGKVLSKTKTQQTLETLENQKNKKLHCRHYEERKCVNIHPIGEEWRLWSPVLPQEKTID